MPHLQGRRRGWYHCRTPTTRILCPSAAGLSSLTRGYLLQPPVSSATSTTTPVLRCHYDATPLPYLLLLFLLLSLFSSSSSSSVNSFFYSSNFLLLFCFLFSSYSLFVLLMRSMFSFSFPTFSFFLSYVSCSLPFTFFLLFIFS